MSGRGGQSGFRGGRGGRGGGRGGRGGGRDMPMGDVSFQEMQEWIGHPGKLGVKSDVVPTLVPPTAKEVRNAMFQLDYLRHQRFSPYWPTQVPTKSKSTQGLSSTQSRNSEFQGPSLKQVKLQKEVFPQDVWRSYMEGETRRTQRVAQRHARSKVDWAAFDAAGTGAETAGQEGPGEAGGASDEEVGDYEDEVDDDYNQNYFDPGDDDMDDVDEGGDEGGGTFE